MTEHATDFLRAPTRIETGAVWRFRSVRAKDVPPAAPSLQIDARLHVAVPESLAPTVGPLVPAAARGGPLRGRRVSPQDVYAGHFGLSARPFSLVPDPGFLYWSTAHQHAFSMLEYGIVSRAPITLITGEIGTGKTTLIFELLQALPRGVTVGLITNTQGSPDELMRWILLALGLEIPTKADYPDLVARIERHVVAQYAAGRRVVLILDEAQNLGVEALEALRMLTNVNSGKDELLQLVLVGQTELRDLIERPALAQFAQRVTARYHLTAMPAQVSRSYIAHRLRVAGAKRGLFSEAAVAAIHKVAGGIPRLVNQLCDMALLYAYASDQKSVVRATVDHVLDDGVLIWAEPQAMRLQ